MDSPCGMMDVIWDTDLGRDPDDFLAGCFLLSRSDIRLRAITISPGDRDQVALARMLLRETGHSEAPVGAVQGRVPGKSSVGGCHARLMEHYRSPHLDDADGPGWEILARVFRAFPGAVLLTTGPLNNVGEVLRQTDITISKTVSMAGYWAGLGQPIALPEFNFNGCPWAAKELVETRRVQKRMLVGKNVTHQVVYDDELHERLRVAGEQNRPLGLAHELMALRSERAKKLHDPLAAVALVRADVCTWQEVAPVKRNGCWGGDETPGSGIWAATSVDIPLFRRIFAGQL